MADLYIPAVRGLASDSASIFAGCNDCVNMIAGYYPSSYSFEHVSKLVASLWEVRDAGGDWEQYDYITARIVSPDLRELFLFEESRAADKKAFWTYAFDHYYRATDELMKICIELHGEGFALAAHNDIMK